MPLPLPPPSSRQDPPCDGDFCSCTYTLEVGLGETVEIVLIDEGDFVNSSHPFHLHGHNFNVIAMERLGELVWLFILF